jgi:enterochelin esterase-like enzyme
MRYAFRYRGDARSVRLRGGLEAMGDTQLARDGDTWSIELDLPADVRSAYWFALDGEEEWRKWLPDPENPKQYVYPAGLHFTGDEEVVASLLEGPDAPPLRWSVARDVPHGRVTLDELDGRRVWRYEPAAPAEAVVLVFDGHEYVALAHIATVLDNLIADGIVPPVAAVLPDSPETEQRFRELGGDPAFLAWCTERLLPWSGLAAPRERTVVAGSSMGGLAATWFAVERADLFGGAVVQSGGFPGMPVQVPPGLPVRWHLDVGVLEDRLLDGTRVLRDDLLAKGYELSYREYPGGHDFFWWQETIADGLAFLLSG